MEVQELKAKIARGENGFYMFVGEEEYLKRYYLGVLKEKIVPDAFLEPFNYALYDGGEIDFGKLLDAVKSPPMMADNKLIVWKYPEIDRMREKGRDALEEFGALAKEYPYATVVLLVGSDAFDIGNLPKKPSKLYTRYSKVYDIVNFKTSTDAQLISWLARHLEAEGVTANADTLRALLFRSGHSMDTLASEVEKLAAYAKANGLAEITPKEVEFVASSTIECDTFALSTAIGERNHALAFRVLSQMKLERVDPLMVLGMLIRTYTELLSISTLMAEGKGADEIAALTKINAYKVKLALTSVKRSGHERIYRATRLLGEIDAKAKSYTADTYALLERFLAVVL